MSEEKIGVRYYGNGVNHQFRTVCSEFDVDTSGGNQRGKQFTCRVVCSTDGPLNSKIKHTFYVEKMMFDRMGGYRWVEIDCGSLDFLFQGLCESVFSEAAESKFAMARVKVEMDIESGGVS